MSLAMDSDCIQCYLRRNVAVVAPLGDQAKTTRFLKKLMQEVLDAPETAAATCLGPQTAQLMHDMYGLPLDRFYAERIASNTFVLERLPQIREKIQSAPDPILRGLQYAILGNYLDFSALQGKVDFSQLDNMLLEAEQMELDAENYAAFCADLEKGGKLLYLTDNAGEIGFDRLFAEAIQEKYPQVAITFCVRGAITANDATREDARQVGLTFPVIDNGNNIAGTVWEALGTESKAALETADIILAKGMANTETMIGCGRNVYYAFLVKCPRFVRLFGKEMFTPMLVRDRDGV